jgi:hypothetical protein
MVETRTRGGKTAEHLVGGAVNYAHAVKAGPFVFLNGHEGYDFAGGVAPAVEGAAAFRDYGKPRLRREADYMLDRTGQIPKSFGTADEERWAPALPGGEAPGRPDRVRVGGRTATR